MAPGIMYHESCSKLDSNVDNCVVGNQVLIVHDTHPYVNAVPYSDTLPGMDNKPLNSAVLAYDDPNTGNMGVVLVIHQAIYIEEMDNNLLCPMQMRMNDVKIDGCPQFLAETYDDHFHLIHFPSDDNFHIKLYLHGVTSYFMTRKPMIAEYQTCRNIDLTYKLPQWNPHSLTYSEQEEYFIKNAGQRT
jgi:hypothetical protein